MAACAKSMVAWMHACSHLCSHARIYDDMPATSTQYLSIFAELGILEVLKVQVMNAEEAMRAVIAVHLPDHLLSGTAVLLEIILQDGDCVMQLDTPIARQRRMEGHDFAREVRASRANVLATTPAFRVP